jgi:hypothetical protein
MMAVTNSAANRPTSPATKPFGVQWYAPLEPMTATRVTNCTTFKKYCKGASNAV